MGGLALKGENTFTRRYKRDEYDKLEKEIYDILKDTFVRYETPRFYRTKDSFGDMDIIISMEGFNGNMKTYIEETFKPTEIFHNGNVWSFDYKELQIDFITCSPEHFDTNRHYLSFNDLGNLMGRIAQKMGIKYGQKGLWYNHYHNGQKVGKVTISDDYPKIFKHLGLSYDRWLEGFETLEEIFDYVITSKYFSPDQYQLNQLNKVNRDRNAKRKSYMSFLDYIRALESNEEAKKLVLTHKENVVDIIAENFPESNIKREIKKFEYYDALRAYSKAKFNGSMVMTKYGLKGKELGEAMRAFKDDIVAAHGSYHESIVKLSDEEIITHFENTYNYMVK